MIGGLKNLLTLRCNVQITYKPTLLTIEKLFHSGKLEWNNVMLREMMNEKDAFLVENIPLSRKGISNKLIWRESVNGLFLVKLAYFEARRVLQKENMERNNREELWRWLWTTNAILKVKFFMWRLLMRAVPKGCRLQEKDIVGDYRCLVCGSRDESIKHVFFDCKLSKEV